MNNYRPRYGNEGNIDSRVTRVETALTAQSGQIKELGTELHGLQARVENGFESIRQAIYASKQVPWTTLLSAGALIVTVGALVMTTIGGIRGEVNARFVEVETQFRGVAREMQTQVDNNKERASQGSKDIESMRSVVNGIDGHAGLKERLAKAEQQLEDHDKYLWPVQLQQAKEQAEISKQIGRNTSAIEAISRYLEHSKKTTVPSGDE